MSNGKGSTRRPHDVPTDTVADNWARTFGGGAQARDHVPPTDGTCQHFASYVFANVGPGATRICADCGATMQVEVP